jgi:AcrR family transcriptional regulator
MPGPLPAPVPTEPASAPRTARARVREEMTAEILDVAGAHVAREGAAAVSLRAIARDLGMAPSALYRYFDGRDALLSALILGAYEALATEAERAADLVQGQDVGAADCFSAVPGALRRWALEHPHLWGLIFGTPVPGYEAPEDTVAPYARVAEALVRPLVDAERAGRLGVVGGDGEPRSASMSVSDELAAAVAPVSAGLLPGMPLDTVVLALQAWTTIVGCISLEVFGHWRNTVLEPGLLFDAEVRRTAASLGLR